MLAPPGVTVRRRVAEALLCRAEYALAPRFGAGDAFYVDKPYAPPYLPPALAAFDARLGHPPLLCVRTAQRDKRAGRFGKAASFVEFEVARACLCLVMYDARARHT